MSSVIGICRLCGTDTVLTFEHIPPRSAFNRWPIRIYPGRELVEHVASQELPWDLSKREYKKYQGGYGAHTLCARCNNYTGREYVPSYAKFSKQAWEQIGEQGSTSGNITISFKDIHPLRIAKEILCMFLSINHVQFGNHYSEIRKMVCDRSLRHELECASVFSYANIGRMQRLSGFSGIFNVSEGMGRYVSELGAIPFGFVLEMNPARERELASLADFFDQYDIDEKANVDLKFPIKQSNSYLPLDYRTQAEILAQMKLSK